MPRNRGLDPTRMLCKDCACDVFDTDLSRAEHRALHLEWAAANHKYPNPTPDNRREAWRGYALRLEELASDLRGQIATRDEVISSLEADYEHVLGEVKAANTEVSRLRDQACMRAHQ